MMDLITIMRLPCSRRWQWLLRGWSEPERIWDWVWDLPYPSRLNIRPEWNSDMYPADQNVKEYIRADLVDASAVLGRDELIELICKAIGGGEKVGMVDFHVAEDIADALLARPSPDAIIAATLEKAAGEAYFACGCQDEIHALNTPETRCEILADAMKISTLKGQTNE